MDKLHHDLAGNNNISKIVICQCIFSNSMSKKSSLSKLQIEFQTFTSQNGVRYVHYKKPNAPIALSITTRCGSVFDPKGKEGLSHFLEHLLLEGSEKFPTKKELSLVLEDEGILYSASTGAEYMRFEFTIADKLQLGIVGDVLDQIFNKSLFSEKKIESEKKVVKTELGAKQDTYKRKLSSNIKTLLFGENSPITHQISGNETSVDSITRFDLLNHLESCFFQNLTVVSCGDCNVTDIVEALDSSLKYKPLNTSEVIDLCSLPTEKFGFTKTDEYKLIYGQLAFKTCSISDPDYVALQMLSHYLGKGRTSLFTEILRYDAGLLYSVSTGNTFYSSSGYFYMDFSVKEENLEKLLYKVKEAYLALLSNGISEASLQQIKNKILNTSTIRMQTVQDWVDFQYYKEVLNPANKLTYEDYLNEIDNMTTDKLNFVAKKYLQFDVSKLWLVGNVSDPTILSSVYK